MYPQSFSLLRNILPALLCASDVGKSEQAYILDNTSSKAFVDSKRRIRQLQHDLKRLKFSLDQLSPLETNYPRPALRNRIIDIKSSLDRELSKLATIQTRARDLELASLPVGPSGSGRTYLTSLQMISSPTFTPLCVQVVLSACAIHTGHSDACRPRPLPRRNRCSNACASTSNRAPHDSPPPAAGWVPRLRAQ
jgi:hypothetical protein